MKQMSENKMPLIISLGSNLGDREKNLEQAIKILSSHFKLRAKSHIYESDPVDYIDQPAFLNQLLEFELPLKSPQECLKIILSIEEQMGRVRSIPKGPRTIDIDIIFFGDQFVEEKNLTIPHPLYQNRNFILVPLKELPSFPYLNVSNHGILKGIQLFK